MAKKSGPKEAKEKKVKPSVAERVAAPVKKAGKTIRDTATKAVANTIAINTTVINHAEANAHDAFAALRKVASARTIQDVVKVQTEFVKAQSVRSTAQVREVGEMIASFGRDAISMLRGK